MANTDEPGVPFPFLRKLQDDISSSFQAIGDFMSDSRRTNGPGIFPIPGLHPVDGGDHPMPPPGYGETLGRAKYEAYRAGTQLFIVASGTVPLASMRADIRPAPWKIFPQQFQLWFYGRHGGLEPQITRDFKFTETFGFPVGPDHCVIHDADGSHSIAIQPMVDSPALQSAADGAAGATGVGASLQEAFDNAARQIADLPGTADALVTIRLVETGLIRGGIAGLHQYYAKVAVV